MISSELKNDHLFLLIGGNPIPNWVAAQLLLRPEGTLYLVYSNESAKIATQLAGLLGDRGHKKIKFINILDASDSTRIYQELGNAIKGIQSGQIGLNYTGGTSVMAVHVYRAIQTYREQGLPEPRFSYLDARTSELRFDATPNWRRDPQPTFTPETTLSLTEIFKIHDRERIVKRLDRDAQLWPVSQTVANLMFSKPPHFAREWRAWIQQFQRSDSTQPLTAWLADYRPIAEALIANSTLTMQATLQDVIEAGIWGDFKKVSHILDWFKGRWLEMYLYGFIQQHQKVYGLNDCARNLELRLTDFIVEVDASAMRGYRLYFISATVSKNMATCKGKLFELYIRARQIGGDEARAAIVCMLDNPELVQKNVDQALGTPNRVRVFGRNDLPVLHDKFTEWFRS